MVAAFLIAMPDISHVTIALTLLVVAYAGPMSAPRWIRRHLTRDGRALAQRLKKYEAR
jgi:hypothetical protein